MAKTMNSWRLAGWGALGALLLTPAVAMQFTTEVNWDETDFIVMGVLLAAVGLTVEFLFRRSGKLAYRLAAAGAVLTSFLTIWANLAVGMIASEDNPYNLLFLLPIAVVLLGSVATRFRPAGMALATAVAAALQLSLALGGMPTDMRGGIFSAMFTLPWLLATALFWASRDGSDRVGATA